MLTRNRVLTFVCTMATICTSGLASSPALTPVPIRNVQINDAFWSPKREVWRTVTINDCFDKFEKDGALTNFDKIRDGKGGEHGGPPWYDGLIYETITGASDFMAEKPDQQLEHRIDGYIQRIAAAAAKDPDGYINTYTQLKEPTHRWGGNGGNDLWQHDLYNAGCLVEAGVHYYRATGKTDLLRVAARMANYMCEVMGPPPRRNLIPGHAIAELSFTEMYQLFRDQPELKKQMPFAVDESKYVSLAQFWVDARGNHNGRPDFGAYDQDDIPVSQQPAIEGHAVRATLLATGITALAPVTDRSDYFTDATRLWDSMVYRRMYVTGGVGAIAGEEKFGGDFNLPNNGYLETCAAVAAGMFHERMNQNLGDARYADELERVLYNGALCGVSLNGNRYFYQNPLEAGKNRLRWAWHSCPCCPPMFLKLFGGMPGEIYATDSSGLFINLYVGSTVQTNVAGSAVSLRQETRYPWEGRVRLTIESDPPSEFDLNFRIPDWCQTLAGREELYKPLGRPETAGFFVLVNGNAIAPEINKGYAKLHRRWSKGDVIEITMQMPARRIVADSRIASTAGRIALSRGPVVYCLESVDNNGRVRDLSLPDDAKLSTEYRPEMLGGVAVIHTRGLASFAGAADPSPADITAIPYFANANRGPVSMCVWIPRSAADALPASIAESATATASHTNPSDTLSALNDGRKPKASDDETISRFTWWDHRGTAEWVQYTFDHPQRISAVSVYWWDESRLHRHCRVPESWKLMYRTADGKWAPVEEASSFGTKMDQFNRVTFKPIETTAIRIEAQLQPNWSAGILQWQIEGAAPRAGGSASH